MRARTDTTRLCGKPTANGPCNRRVSARNGFRCGYEAKHLPDELVANTRRPEGGVVTAPQPLAGLEEFDQRPAVDVSKLSFSVTTDPDFTGGGVSIQVYDGANCLGELSQEDIESMAIAIEEAWDRATIDGADSATVDFGVLDLSFTGSREDLDRLYEGFKASEAEMLEDLSGRRVA